jgi:long-chain fatty acid transport protein
MKTSTFTKLTSGIALSLVTSTMLHATNGDTLIAVGAKSRGMGGTGIGISHGAESTLANPAMITTVEGTEISFGGTIFMPTIKTTINTVPGMPPQDTLTSDADMNMIPEVSLAHKLTDNWYIGIGMWGTAGMGTDYRGKQNLAAGQFGNLNMVTNLQLMQFAVPIAYKSNGFSAAVAPILQYGNLDINYAMPDLATGTVSNIGAGLAQDFGFGWSAGLSYDFSNGLTIGAVYKSAIEMNYDGQLSTATAPFVALGAFPAPMSDTLEQPAEYGIGLSYVMGQHTFAFDYKKIKWSDATGYKDFGWEDQNVYAFGYQYAQDNWALRVGYNYGSSAVVEQSGATTPQGIGAQSAQNFFNLLGFPATEEKHITLGGTYAFSQTFSLDLAYVRGLGNKETFAIPAFAGFPPAGFGTDSITTDHSEDSLSFQLTYKF